MGTEVKKIGLFVPAWWPCSFFEEQQAIYADEYELYNLYGTCEWVSQKAQIRQLLSCKSPNQLTSRIDGRQIEVGIKCAKYNSIPRLARAITHMSERIGQLILSMTDGRMPKFVYIQSISDIAVFVAEWAKKNGIKIILAEHVLYIRHEVSYISQRKERLYSIANQVFCVSNYLYRNLLTNGIRMQNVRVIGNLVNAFAVPEDWEAVKKNGRVMFVAGHVADKDMATFFEVAKRLEKQGVQIDVFGLSGKEKYEGKTLNERSGDNVQYMGKMSHEDVLKQYSAYSVLLSTSISETFGLSVAEAIAHGTPVVCTDSGGVRDFVNEENGIVVGIKIVDAIVVAIDTCFKTNYNYSEMSLEILDKYGNEAYTQNALIKI